MACRTFAGLRLGSVGVEGSDHFFLITTVDQACSNVQAMNNDIACYSNIQLL